MKFFFVAAFFLFIGTLFGAPTQAETPDSWRDELIYRTANGQAADVSLLLDQLGQADITDSLGEPLLFIAASRSDDSALEIVKTLVAKGADINSGGKGGHYPILAAVQSGHVSMVKFMLDSGADYRVRDSFGVSVREYARQGGNEDIHQLIEQKIAADAAEQAELRSATGFARLRYALAFHSCALQYYGYYYNSGQDEIAQNEQDKTLKTHKDAISKAMQQLRIYFKTSHVRMTAIYQDGKLRVFEELEGLISNRWRRKNGVGQPGDMKTRCNKHAPLAMEAVEVKG